jgi:phenylalanyl-tRNA synthetase alpha chain
MDIDSLNKLFADDLAAAGSEADLRSLRDKYLSRKNGLISTFLKNVAAAPVDERPALGQAANQLKQHIDTTLTERLAAAAARRPVGDAIDVTLPGRPPLLGHRHPLTLLRERIESIFLRIGFLIVEGPELEDDYHNFEALNMPAEHPARDMQDTLYLASPVPAHGGGRPATLLRTHTSGMQIRYMETHKPPIRLIAPGRVYRRDGLDLTHSPMFTQVEGLVVGEGITLADLKGTLIAFARELFGPERKTRFRPSFFPYTEPSGELDISCASCGGSGVCDVQADRLDRSARQRHGPPRRVRGGRLRPRDLHRLRVRRRHRAAGAAQVGRRGHPPLLRERPAVPGAVPAVKLPYLWLCEFVKVSGDPDSIATTLGLRGFEVASVQHGHQPVIDFEITANRPDCLNVLGLAREAAAAYGLPLQHPDRTMPPAGQPQSLDVTIEDPELCPRYCAQVFEVRSTGTHAGVDARSARGLRRAQHQSHRRRHELRDARDGAADACLRLRESSPGGRCASGARNQARSCGPWTAWIAARADMLVIADGDRAQAIGGVMAAPRPRSTAARS